MSAGMAVWVLVRTPIVVGVAGGVSEVVLCGGVSGGREEGN